ncbi:MULTISPECIES: EcsC family protein [Shouchella]|uniref:EcsC family protein n=3 Tax=Bacillaceae TaxID=186817 RepID=A0A060M061_9BACI|nr:MULTISPECIES: EcsC family protein [Bacillaceae]RQW19786.1 EcsC family protein [Bacillus sp. C1-1]AIC93933.1 hypothetical protein BleG1_1350 [Shouchella lehensis G1]KQL55873.1 hypothetical protein AN965_16450 [Alkalicoccobacillus plakortidis]MBG9785535.1 hypothetical protein [Shouchella lehensis]TES47973.1 EcsC family protein [Shouchella lehensis]
MNVKGIEEELAIWKRQQQRPESHLKKKVGYLQETIQDKMPKLYHTVATQCVKRTAETIMYGIDKSNQLIVKEIRSFSLEEADQKAVDLFRRYRRMALAEGIGTGAGGFVAGAMDFPLFLSLKLKALFEVAHLYGFSTETLQDRFFILLLFQFSYGNRTHRLDVLKEVEAYIEHGTINETNWEQLQLQYRDTIDIPKTLQLLPVVGAVFGGTANYYLFTKLEENTIQLCRMRWLAEFKRVTLENE